MLPRLAVTAEISVRAPDLLACFLIKRGDVLLFLVVTQDHQQVTRQRGRTSSAQIEVNRICFERSGPSDIAFQVKGPKSEIRHIHVNRFAISHRSLGNETVFAMTTSGRTTGIELFLPFRFAAFQVETIEHVMKRHLAWQLDVALGHTLDYLLHRESLFL